MTYSATQRNIRSILDHPTRSRKLNILTFTTHERYESHLCRTGHNFYAINYGKEWDSDYADIPQNYQRINYIPEYLDIDIVLAHTSCERLQITHDILSQTKNSLLNRLAVPILRHTHTLPDIRLDVEEQIKIFKSIPVYQNSFISNFSRNVWGYNENNACVIEHGIDTDFWHPDDFKRENLCLSVVNDWPNRDWCCGFNLWKETILDLPAMVVGKCPGFSIPAKSTTELRNVYQRSKIFYNTSLHSPVPTAMLEAMACGCAVVSTATCMIPELIENGVNGFISNDPKELRSYLELLLSDNDLAKTFGDNARKTIIEKYNLEKFCNNWNKLLYSTIERYKEKS